MLFNPGPIPRLDVDALLTLDRDDPLEGLVADHVHALDAPDATIGAHAEAMRDALAHADPDTFAGLVDAATGAHDAIAESPGETNAAEIAAANAERVRLEAIAAVLPSDHVTPDPVAMPPVDVGPDTATPPPLTAAEFDATVSGWYRAYLQRDPSGDELASHRGNPAGLAGVLATILASAEYAAILAAKVAGGAPPPSPPPTPSPTPSPSPQPRPDACTLLALYAAENSSESGHIHDFLDHNPGDCGRAPSALALPGWTDFLHRHGWS